jgi:8-oxo-dGTP pyrophosphatase MutT (NUDIX family)
MTSWKTLSSEEVYSTPWIRVRRDQVLTHQNKEIIYSIVEIHHPSVFIVAVNDKGAFYLQKNYRYSINQMIWELPAGNTDGEDPLLAAKRELQEETGLVSDEWASLGKVYQALGTTNFPLFVFLAKNVQLMSEPDEEELIVDHQFVDITKLKTMIETGDMINATDIGVLFMAISYLEKETQV